MRSAPCLKSWTTLSTTFTTSTSSSSRNYDFPASPLLPGFQMKIIIPGGTGQVGHILSRAFIRDGHEVVILTRNPSAAGPARMVQWDAKSPGNWTREIEGADIVINLAGRSVNCRYTPANRREITQSRVDSTRAIGLAIRDAVRPPRIWLQASTATI